MEVTKFYSSLLSFFIVLVNFAFLSHGAPRGPTDTAGITDNLKPIGKLAYTIENATPPPTDGQIFMPKTAGEGNGGGNFLSILNNFFDKNEIVSSLIHFISKASAEATQSANDQEKQQIYGEKFAQENERIKNDEGRRKIMTEKMSRISAAKTSISSKAIQLDDEPEKEFNIDSAPASVSQTDSKLPPMSEEWKSTLFGPKGMLTEVFRFVNEKRKQGFEKATPQSDLPPAPANDSKFDFAKIFESLIKNNNGFDEPKIPELPFIGICNRLNCGDIYKAVDQFKKSELFSNFQTAISLIQDPKGWDIIGELLENPELIEQYVGKSGGNIQGLLEKSVSTAGKKTASNSMSILPSDGDLGIDFTNEIDGGVASKGAEKPIAVATSIDAGSEYYGTVDKTPKDYDYDGGETVEVEEIINSKATTSTEAPTSTVIPKKTEPPLPELSFSVDETPEISSSVDTEPDYGTKMEIDEVIPQSKSESEFKKPMNALERRFVLTTSTSPTTTTTRELTTQLPITKPPFSTHPKKITTPKPRVNFRKSDDYYSMYYDNN